ncbi:MAG: type II secretion system F family protein [Deltaproteobacteria bacterium]|nr:type II secretion system F family protein [Deltaproteobacteria bacterium]
MRFLYKARDRKGALYEGIYEAEDSNAVVKHLRGQDFLPISVKPEAKRIELFSKKKLVKPKDLINITRQLGSMLRAGITLLNSLGMIIGEIGATPLGGILKIIRIDIEGGSSLSQAMGKHPIIFDPVAVNVVRAGEIGGNLGEALERLADLKDFDERNKNSIKSATRYPKLVMAALGLALIVIFSFVIPRFMNLFGQLGTEMPLPTRIIIGIQQGLANLWYYLLGLIAVIVFFVKRYLKTPKGAYNYGKLLLRIPVLGNLALQISIVRFARFFGTLYQFGIPVIEALGIVAPIIANPVVSKAIRDVQQPISEGEKMSIAFAKQEIFTPFVIQLLAIGEATGDIPSVLNRMAVFYEDEVERNIKRLTALIEPVLIVGMGVVILFIALSVYLPMWSIFKALGRGGK